MTQARSYKGTSMYLLVVMIILTVAIYTAKELNVLDKVRGPVDSEEKTEFDKKLVNEPTSGVSNPETRTQEDDDVDKDDDDDKTEKEEKKDDVQEGQEDDDEMKNEVKNEVENVEPVDCNKFDHGDFSSLEGVDSMFNCGSESGQCNWFFPAKFFHECGLGSKYMSHIAEMKRQYDAQELWLSGPPIVLPNCNIVPERMRKNPYKPDQNWTRHNLSMTHVHKTGGTSLVTAFCQCLNYGGKGKRRTLYMPGKKTLELSPAQQRIREERMAKGEKVLTGPRKSVIYGKNYEEGMEFLNEATKYKRPEEWGDTDHTLFGVVRDPAERFISAIGQATGAFGSTSNGIGKKLLDECLKETSKETLNCFINLMHTNSTWIEVHFTPMAMEVAFATAYQDIPVAIFPFTQVPNLLAELGANPNGKKKDGHSSNYRKSPILTNMSVNDYDDDMLKRLCEIYEMDAVFLNQMRMETRCDNFLSKI